MYKIVACDLDGTLLRDDKTISEETVEILKKVTQMGVVFLPSTGRTHRELPPVIRELPFLRYALCCNGAAIYDYEKNAYIYEDAIPHDIALKVLEYVKTIPVYETVVVNGERIAKGDENDELIDYIKEKAVKGILFNLKGAHDVKAAFSERKQDAQKIMLYLNHALMKQVHPYF